jgi:hypothetical protein
MYVHFLCCMGPFHISSPFLYKLSWVARAKKTCPSLIHAFMSIAFIPPGVIFSLAFEHLFYSCHRALSRALVQSRRGHSDTGIIEPHPNPQHDPLYTSVVDTRHISSSVLQSILKFVVSFILQSWSLPVLLSLFLFQVSCISTAQLKAHVS